MPESAMRAREVDRCVEELERSLLVAWDRMTSLLPRQTARVGEPLSAVALFDASGDPVLYPQGSNPIWIPPIRAAIRALDLSADAGGSRVPLGVGVPAGLPVAVRASAVPVATEAGDLWGVCLAALPSGADPGSSPAAGAGIASLEASLPGVVGDFGSATLGAAVTAIAAAAREGLARRLGALMPGTATARGLILGDEGARVCEAAASLRGESLTVTTRLSGAGAHPSPSLEGFVGSAVERAIGLLAHERAALAEVSVEASAPGAEGAPEGTPPDELEAGLAAAALTATAIAKLAGGSACLGAGGVMLIPEVADGDELFMDGMLVGGGACRDGDGEDVLATPELGDVDVGDLESWEGRVASGEFRGRVVAHGSAGPGKHRGGAGLVSAFNPVVAVPGGVRELRLVVPGLFGGRAGAPAASIRRSSDHPGLHALLSPGEEGSDSSLLISAGGPGFGDQLERDPGLVEADVRAGRLSVEAAKAAYGVVLDSRLIVDRDATEAARAGERGRRLDESAGWEELG